MCQNFHISLNWCRKNIKMLEHQVLRGKYHNGSQLTRSDNVLNVV
jgi:hypothetical protein